MDDKKVKSGKEILNEFFRDITKIENVDKEIAKSLEELYEVGKLTDKNLLNALQKIRENNDNKD